MSSINSSIASFFLHELRCFDHPDKWYLIIAVLCFIVHIHSLLSKHRITLYMNCKYCLNKPFIPFENLQFRPPARPHYCLIRPKLQCFQTKIFFTSTLATVSSLPLTTRPPPRPPFLNSQTRICVVFWSSLVATGAVRPLASVGRRLCSSSQAASVTRQNGRASTLLRAGYAPSRKMRCFAQDTLLLAAYTPSRVIRSFTQDTLLRASYATSYKLRSLE